MTTDKKIIKARVGVLELAKQLGNVSEACKIMGYSRDTFYRYKDAVDEGGVQDLVGFAAGARVVGGEGLADRRRRRLHLLDVRRHGAGQLRESAETGAEVRPEEFGIRHQVVGGAVAVPATAAGDDQY